MPLNVDKELPSLPRGLSTPTGSRSTSLAPPSTGGRVNMGPPHPTLVLEKFPSFAELALISSWHDATEARQVRFQRTPAPDDCRRSFPPPMSKAEVLALSPSRANDNATPQKRWGLFTREQSVDAQNLEEKEPRISRPTRFQKFLDVTKAAGSTPNLNSAANAGAQNISRSVRFAPCEATASTSAPTNSTDAPVDELDEASQALGIDVNDGGIYLTFDPGRSSCGEAVLTFLSPIPDGTSNSPPRARVRPVDELQSFLGVEN
ncbi:hypothetical protein BDR03DRAFT_372282 [Suillus americanus]|nr:hypothetical protein BDR03DRAFT_372282 [Suillus americanus]